MPVAYATPTSGRISRATPPSSFVPRDFTEMYERYYVYVLRLVVRQGIHQDDADDAAQFIFIKLMEANLLEQFDPEMVNHGRKAVFSTLLSSFVFKYAMNFHKRQYTVSNRERNLVDLEVGHENANGLGTQPFLDLYFPDFEDEYSSVDDTDFQRHIRSRLAKVPMGRKDNQCNLVALFDEIEIHVAETGKYDTTRLMEKFSVTRTTIHKWLERLRIEVDKIVRANAD